MATSNDNKKWSQAELIMEYFIHNPKRDIKHPEIVDWATVEWKNRTGTVFRDPDRAIRKLSQEGRLIKVGKGVYRYDPDMVINRDLEDFTPVQKDIIMKRDNYRCLICGRGKQDGVELQVDHIKPKDLGGTNDIDNGETLCAQHNFQKKNYGQTEAGKRYFIRLYEIAKKNSDNDMLRFCSKVLELYEKEGIDNQILWQR